MSRKPSSTLASAEAMVELYMAQEDQDKQDSFQDLQSALWYMRNQGAAFGAMVEGLLQDWCLDRDRCPKCAEVCEVETVVLGVHPYGSTTATEYGGELKCPACGWAEEC